MNLLLIVPAAASAGELATDATGRFVARASSAEVARTHADALTRTLDAIPWAFRSVARALLEPQLSACPGYTMTLAGTRFDLQCDGEPGYVWNLGERGPYVTASGQTLAMTSALSDRTITLAFSSSRGTRTWRYTFPESGGLEVRHEVSSPQLAVPLAWTLRYAKP